MGFADQDGIYRRFARAWHILALVTSFGLFTYYLKGSDGFKSSEESSKIVFGKCFFEGLTFLAAFAMNFGMSIWVTFIAGLVMYRNLPLHTFGQIQSKLFPMYFLISTAGGVAMASVIYVQANKLEKLTCDQQTLAGSVVIGLLCNVVNGLWLGPKSSSIMFEKHRIEKEESDKSKLENHPAYKDLKHRFGVIHGFSSLLNLTAMIGNIFILYWLALQLHTLSAPKED